MSGTCIQKLSKTMRHSKTMMRSKTMIHPKTIMHSKAIVHSKCLVNPRGSIYDTYKYTNYDAFKITNPGAFKIKAVMHSKTVMHSRSMCIRKENSGAFKTKTHCAEMPSRRTGSGWAGSNSSGIDLVGSKQFERTWLGQTRLDSIGLGWLGSGWNADDAIPVFCWSVRAHLRAISIWLEA